MMINKSKEIAKSLIELTDEVRGLISTFPNKLNWLNKTNVMSMASEEINKLVVAVTHRDKENVLLQDQLSAAGMEIIKLEAANRQLENEYTSFKASITSEYKERIEKSHESLLESIQ